MSESHYEGRIRPRNDISVWNGENSGWLKQCILGLAESLKRPYSNSYSSVKEDFKKIL